jgi:hypothetical protein
VRPGTSNLDRSAPALPSFGDDSKANLIPFAAMCAGFLAPLLRFWAGVLGFVTFSGAPPVDTKWRVASFLAICGVSAAAWWLPRSWYRTRSFERNGRIYEYAGVHLFRRLVPNGDWVNAWRRRQDPSFRAVRNHDHAMQLLRRTVIGEKSHLVMLCLGFASAAYAWRIGWLGWAAYLSAANLLANLYPILLQRYTRARIDRMNGRPKRNGIEPR